MKTRILGIQVSHRAQLAIEVQKVLTRYGCSIKTRLGLNDDEDTHRDLGLIILELTGDESEWIKLENELLSLEGVNVERMNFNR
jgi:hypothetical protein